MFFNRSNKPTPLPPAVQNLLANPPPVRQAPPNMHQAMRQSMNAAQQAPQGKSESNRAPSNTRFRSFAERYVVERARDWPADKVEECAWEAILQARTIYNKVKEVGRTLGDDN